MDIKKAITQLRQQGLAIEMLTAEVTSEAARWKPDPESWSILEILNHLVDEEVLDFRRHLDHILHTPEQPWPGIDPQAWVIEKAYNQRLLDETRMKFKAEREKSIALLSTLPDPNWEASVNPPWGSLSAGDMLASWLTHDLLHLRQLVALHYHLTATSFQPYGIEYAGKW